MKVGTCPFDGCAVVELHQYPGYVGCVGCNHDWSLEQWDHVYEEFEDA